MASEQDYYRLLGVGREAPERQIKKAYYELARQLHPDKASSPEEASANADKLALISKAYNTLKDAKKREEYDQQLRGRPASAASDVATPPPTAGPGPAVSRKPRIPGQPPAHAQRPAGSPPPPPNQGGGDESARASLIYQQKKVMAQKAFVKGMQLFKRQEMREALNFFEVAVTNDPESEAQYHIKYAQCLMRMKGSYTKAAEHATRACEMDPYNIEFKLILGDIHEQAGVLTKAQEIYEEVLRWDQDNSLAKNKIELLRATSGKGGGSVLDKLTSLFSKGKK